MAADPNAYAVKADLKKRLNITDLADDDTLDSILAAVSQWISNYCSRHFYSATETRYYTAQDSNLLFIDDLVSVTTLQTDSGGSRVYDETWATTDYDLLPENANTDGEPFTMIGTTPTNSYSFPRYRKGVKVVGVFGWSAVPSVIKEACLLQSERLFKRKDAIFGVMGGGGMGQIMAIAKLDPDVELMLNPYRRLV